MFGVLELRGDFRLVQEAHKGVGGVEYHFHGEGALGGDLGRTEDLARAALCDDHAEVLFFPQNSSGSARFTIAALGASYTWVPSRRNRRSSIVAVPIWILRFGHRRVRRSFSRGWTCAVVPLKEPRSSMWAWS